MSNQGDQRFTPSGYMMDAENVAEMARLIRNAREVSQTLGLCPSEITLADKQNILDIACGPGEWVLEVAGRFPATRVTGIDISQNMITYARLTAQDQQLWNAQFGIMDATQPLDLPADTFDLIHARLIEGFLSTANWATLLADCFRLLRPGGVICTVEIDNMGSNTSPALTHYNTLFVEALRRAGKCFTASGDATGIIAVQARLLQEAGFVAIQSRAHVFDFSTGMPAHKTVYENFSTMLHLLQPLILHFDLATPGDLVRLREQALEEMRAETFCGVMIMQSVWGEKPDQE